MIINLRQYFQRNLFTFLIALVWLINGLYCKLLNFVPRHRLIVSRILGEEYSLVLTKFIGSLEVLMFIWILSLIKKRLCLTIQISLIATMNIIEYILAPDLLLFGRFNIILAGFFIGIIIFNELHFYSYLRKANVQQN